MKELYDSLEKLNIEINRILKFANERQQKSLEDFVKIVNNVLHNLERVWETMKKRQDLIDKQCTTHIFYGPLHEEYHRVNSTLENDFNNFFLSLEVSLSRFTTLLIELLPRSDTRGIEHAGLTRFVKSIKRGIFTSNQLKKIAEIVKNEGQEIDDKLSAYRDKKIEHSTDSFSTGFISTGTGGIQREHEPRKYSTFGTPPTNEPDKSKNPPVLIMNSTDRENIFYYLHIESSLDSGDLIKKGDSIGKISDNNCGHFAKHGQHFHLFTTPNVNIGEIATSMSNTLDYSPDPAGATTMILSFFSNVLDCIKTLK